MPIPRRPVEHGATYTVGEESLEQHLLAQEARVLSTARRLIWSVIHQPIVPKAPAAGSPGLDSGESGCLVGTAWQESPKVCWRGTSRRVPAWGTYAAYKLQGKYRSVQIFLLLQGWQ
jgi:hypothetical protein